MNKSDAGNRLSVDGGLRPTQLRLSRLGRGRFRIQVREDGRDHHGSSEKWDTYMKSEDFFNAEKFPDMILKSAKIAFSGNKPASP